MKCTILVNLTNHPSKDWPKEQYEAAICRWGSICDFPFPNVPPEWKKEKVYNAAEGIADKIAAMKPEAVLCQGEMCMTAAIVRIFQDKGILVCAAASGRQAVETVQSDGTVEKQSVFRFVQFRQY